MLTAIFFLSIAVVALLLRWPSVRFTRAVVAARQKEEQAGGWREENEIE